MKWSIFVGALVLSVSLCTSQHSYGFELLDRMLGVGCGCDTCGCDAAPGCGAEPACGCGAAGGDAVPMPPTPKPDASAMLGRRGMFAAK